MGVLQAAGRLQPDHQRLRRREAVAGVEHRPEAAAAEILGDEVGLALVLAPVVDGEHVLMVEGGGRLRLGAEPPEESLVLRQRLMQQLGRHSPPQARVVSHVHQGRRARSDGCDQPVTPAQHPTELVGHPRDDHRSRVLEREDGPMRMELADELEEFIRLGHLWSTDDCAAMVTHLIAESEATDDPLPARLGRFLDAVSIRTRVSDVPGSLRVQIDAIVYPRVWKVIEGIRDGMPDAELRTRIEVMNRRLARLFVEETV